MQTTTAWYASKTLWLNAISFILVVLALPQFNSIIPATWIPAIAIITAVLNAIVRTFFTSTPITATGQSVPSK